MRVSGKTVKKWHKSVIFSDFDRFGQVWPVDAAEAFVSGPDLTRNVEKMAKNRHFSSFYVKTTALGRVKSPFSTILTRFQTQMCTILGPFSERLKCVHIQGSPEKRTPIWQIGCQNGVSKRVKNTIF